MEKTLVSFNVPNMITINLMAWGGFLFLVLLFQFIGKRGKRGSAATNGGEPIVASEGY